MDSFGFFYRFTEHLTIQIISDCIHMPMLLGSQKISCTSKLQIPHGNLEAASQICVFTDCSQSLLCSLLQHHILSVHQKCVSRAVGPSDSASQLIKLGESISVRIMDDHGINIGNIQPCLNDGSGNQHINISIYKTVHNVFQFPLAHLPVGKIYSCLRHQLCNAQCHICNIRYPIINIIHLPASAKLPVNGFPYSLFIILHYISLDRHSVHGRLLQYAHISDPDQTHMKGSGNRCGSKSKYIHIFFQLLYLLLVSDPETLLLIYDQKTQIFKFHILGQDPVGSDHHIHLSFFQIFNCLFLLGRRAETAEQLHTYRKFLHSLDKSIINLLSQNGGRC